MEKSKGWEWEKANQSPWLKPTDDVYYLANKWLELGFRKVLDLGSGLGRHSIYFAEQGFEVSAIDISDYGVNYLKDWAEKEQLDIDVRVGDIVTLPYEDNSFDCVIAYHSISHADTEGIKRIISEVERVLKKGGEIFMSMCSKESWEYSKSEFPKIDDNTVIKKEDGPENDVPHFYTNREDILNLLHNFDISRIRHIDYCFLNGENTNIKHYYINGCKK
jgi:SAM-dependent methyltransferase